MRTRLGILGLMGLLAVWSVTILASDGAWFTKASMTTARNNLSVGVINGRVYAVGGWARQSPDDRPVLQPRDQYVVQRAAAAGSSNQRRRRSHC
jgi:hypothetical protein